MPGSEEDEDRAEEKPQGATVTSDGTDGTAGSGHGAPSSTYKGNFGGVPLLIPTRTVERYINRYLPLRSYFRRPPTPAGGWGVMPDDPWPLTPELNVLYWPTGCTRWGFGVFLFSGEWLDAIIDKVNITGTSNGDGMNFLELGDPNDPDHFVRAKMRPLTPIPVTGDSQTSSVVDGYPLYLLPLVDHRFAAQGWLGKTGASQGFSGATLETSELLARFGQAFSGAMTYDTSVIQNLPDFSTHVDEQALLAVSPTNYLNAAQSAEAVAWSLGLTFIVEPDGSKAHYVHASVAGNDGATNGDRLNELVEKINGYTFTLTAGFVAGADKQAAIGPLVNASIPRSVVLSIAGLTSDAVNGSTHISSNGNAVFEISAEDVLGVKGGAFPWNVVAPIIMDVDRDEAGNPLEGGTSDQDAERVRQLLLNFATEWLIQLAVPVDGTLADICKVPLSSHTDIVEWSLNRRGPQTRIRSRRAGSFPNRLVNQFNSGGAARRIPRRFERVTIATNGNVRWNNKTYPAELPLKTDGFAEFTEGDQVIAGWEPEQRKFWITNNRPLDLDFINEHVEEYLRGLGYFDED